MEPQVIISNPQKPMADVLHCEGHICSSMTDHSSLGQTWHLRALLNGKTRKGRRGIVVAESFTEMTDNIVMYIVLRKTSVRNSGMRKETPERTH